VNNTKNPLKIESQWRIPFRRGTGEEQHVRCEIAYSAIWKEQATMVGLFNASSEPARVIGVFLAKKWLDEAKRRAEKLRADNRKQGARDKMQNEQEKAENISEERALVNDFLGLRCEMAVAYAIGLPFKRRAQYHKADIGSIYQVRGRAKHDWDLLVYADDNPDHVFVLATSEDPRKVIVHGWLWGRECMRDQFWRHKNDGKWPRARKDGWWIPRRYLRPMFIPYGDGKWVLSLPIDPAPPRPALDDDQDLALPPVARLSKLVY